jgi:TetR/AcrR family transcriptional regulator, transcriptional repressor for nem operon
VSTLAHDSIASGRGAPAEASAPMRERIKALARDLLIQYGYRGVSFGDLAAALETTRANIHYHFGHKQQLVEEVLVDYTAETIRGTWAVFSDPGMTFTEKIESVVAFSRRRYAKYNPPGKEGRPWSLIARMRQDGAFLTPRGHEALQDFARDLHACIMAAVVQARDRKEFSAAIPVEDVALQLFSIANSASPITQDAGSFDRLEQLYLGFARIISHAFGRPKRARAGTRKGGTTEARHRKPAGRGRR